MQVKVYAAMVRDVPATVWIADAGVKAIIGTSGSIKDGEVMEFCTSRGVVMYLIPDRKARGFFGH